MAKEFSRANDTDTYMAAVLVDPKRPLTDSASELIGQKDSLQVVIKAPEIAGVFHTRLTHLSKQLKKSGKGLSLGKQEVHYKQTKKMRVIRHFVRKQSVFKDFIEVTARMLDEAFERDIKFVKTAKFVRPGKEGLPLSELEDINTVLRENYSALKDHYTCHIAASVSAYPTIGWLDFVNYCHEWKVLEHEAAAPK